MGAGLAIFATLALAIAGIYMVLQIFANFSPGRNKVQKDLKTMKVELQPFVSDLVPINKKELELLSLNQINKGSKKRVAKTAKGIFTSIYHEPMIAYTYKKYVKKDHALLYARTSKHEFVFHFKGKETEISIDDQVVGSMKSDGILYGKRSQKALAQVNKNTEGLLLPVLVGDKEVASIINPAKLDKANPRAFEFVSDMDEREEALLLSLAILEMVEI